MSDRVLNMSTVLGYAPLAQRPALAKQMGYGRVESWWDFASATPPAAELDAFVAAVEDAGVELVAMNSHGGDRAGKERGLACLPDRVDEFRASIESVADISRRLGPKKFNVTFGELQPTWPDDEQFRVAADNYRWAAERVGEFDGTILIEALSGQGGGRYPFRTGRDVVEFLTGPLAGVDNVGFLFDTFHLAANGEDIVDAWDATHEHVRHVQLADFPGRGAPGSGELPIDALVERIAASDYAGDIALEYLGTAPAASGH